MTTPPWHTLLVRAWSEAGRLRVRFLAVDEAHGETTIAVETNVEAATRLFGDWLHEVTGERAGDAVSTEPDTGAP